jgi:predicted N-acetyltransferase YhbS
MVVGFAGYANCGFDADAFGLLWCNVHPMFKNKGVGKALVEIRIQAIRNDGGKFVLSSQREEVTWHLERFGFDRLKENGEYDGDKYYLMHKIL